MKLLGRVRALLRSALRAPVGFVAKWAEPRVFEHELAVCAIFREEAPFLDEWISFHHGVGATHFYLYNNFSTDHFRDVLAPWIARGVVTLIEWPYPVGQVAAYHDCIARARRRCRWVAFIDLDEFLFSPLTVDIRGVLARYADLPGIEVWQLYFGSSGHAKRPALPVTEAYLMRAPLHRNTAKTIANPRLIYRAGVHQAKYWYGTALDTDRRPVEPGRAPVLDRLRINHYWSRSLEDPDQKVARHDASTAERRDRDWHFNFEAGLNSERDDSILPVARSVLRRSAPSR